MECVWPQALTSLAVLRVQVDIGPKGTPTVLGKDPLLHRMLLSQFLGTSDFDVPFSPHAQNYAVFMLKG